MSEKLTMINDLKSKVLKKSGKKARESLSKIFDEGTFIETNVFFDAGVITGYGQVNGRLVYAFAGDNENDGGAIGKSFAEKVIKCQDDAVKVGAPIVCINDSIGVKLLEGNEILSAYSKILKNSSNIKGMVPQISINFSKNVGVASMLCEIGDFTFSFDDANNDFLVKTEDECFDKLKKLLSFLPQNYIENAEVINTNDDLNRECDELNNLVPIDDKVPFDISSIIKNISDDNLFVELKSEFAKNIIIGYIRLGGETIGVVANNSKEKDAVLDRDAIDKAVKFIEICDFFGISILTLVDTDSTSEKYASELVNAYSLAEVPLVTIIVRRAYGSGYISMCPKYIGADVVYAYPEAKIAVMKADSLVNIVYEKEISKAINVSAERVKYIKALNDKEMTPDVAASIGIVDDVIEPSKTRKMLIAAFDMLYTKNEY